MRTSALIMRETLLRSMFTTEETEDTSSGVFRASRVDDLICGCYKDEDEKQAQYGIGAAQ
jgi:hypothetical protein